MDLRIPGKPQRHALSCESRSACDLLAAYGLEVDEDTFLVGLCRSDNPDEGFVGDVDGPGGLLPPAGYGVHEGPLAVRIRESSLPVEAVRGADLAWLRRRLGEGVPVIVWATGDLSAPPAVRLRDAAGAWFVAVPGEHTYLAVGYEPGAVLLLDPATGHRKRAPDVRFDASWATLGRRAVAALGPPVQRPGFPPGTCRAR